MIPIDPATTKLIAKVAIDVVTDEEKRKKLLLIILAPIIGIVLLLSLFFYLLTSPLTLLSQWLSPDETTHVEDMQINYGYDQSRGIYEVEDEPEVDKSYDGVKFDSGGVVDVVYFNQGDGRWKYKPYGTDKIGSHGCGPTSMSIVISSLTDKTVDPPAMCKWSVDNGHWCSGQGSYHTLIPKAAEAFGVPWKSIALDDAQGLVNNLKSGKLVVAIMSKGHFTGSGHFMVLRGVTKTGKILVADPGSKTRSEKEWDLSIILNEARRGAGAGGPFWAMG